MRSLAPFSSQLGGFIIHGSNVTGAHRPAVFTTKVQTAGTEPVVSDAPFLKGLDAVCYSLPEPPAALRGTT